VAGEARTAWILGTIGALALLVIGVGAVTGYVVSGRLARPVLSLRDAAVRLGDGDFTIEVPPSHVTEIDEAGAAVMATARRLDELVKRERMFSSDVSHQLRTPVAGLRAAIETELEFPREDSAEVLQEALVDLERLEKTIGELLAIARRRNDATQAISPDDLVQEVAGNWDKRFASVGRELVVSPHDETPPVRASRSMLIHTLDVLLDNALSHGEGEVQVRSQVGEEFVTLSVTDQGPGFSVVTGDSIPSSNAATAPGLGLPLAERLVEAMGGRLSVSRAGDQPRVDVVLKRADR